jgi:hypothetical protein
MRTAAAAVRAKFFEHKHLSPCVDQNGNGHLAVVSSADEVQFTTVGRRACVMASASLRAAVGDGGSELLSSHVNVSEIDGRKRTTTATTPTASARIFVEVAALSPISERSKNEGVRGPGAIRRDIPACANAPKSTKPGLPRSPRSAAMLLIAPDGSGVTHAEAMLTVRRGINLCELEITEVGPIRAVTRAVILEIAGRERGREKTSLLAERMAGDLRTTSSRSPCRRKWITKHLTGRCSCSPQRSSRR